MDASFAVSVGVDIVQFMVALSQSVMGTAPDVDYSTMSQDEVAQVAPVITDYCSHAIDFADCIRVNQSHGNWEVAPQVIENAR